jgi:hypothetical protein
MEKELQYKTIQSRAAWKVVYALCAIYGIDVSDANEAGTFYSVLVKKCFDEAKKEVESSN